MSIQLLDLMHTLHTRTAQIFKWWAEEHGDDATVYSLWPKGWCPLLQGIARLCCDSRKQVSSILFEVELNLTNFELFFLQIRMSAITYLQRALLMPDLQNLSGPEWEACFHNVLFPLLNQLLETPTQGAIDGLEEARMRAATVLSKVSKLLQFSFLCETQQIISLAGILASSHTLTYVIDIYNPLAKYSGFHG